MADIEMMAGGSYAQLTNMDIRSFGWRGVSVCVNDRQSKQPKEILSDVNGFVRAGELLALMGPSGSGKSTLLNVLAQRTSTLAADIQGSMFINGRDPDPRTFRRVSAYVEQEDALVGSLTVRETLNFATRLALPSTVGKAERMQRIESLLKAFGLQHQANTLVGTPIRKGISGGQKRRLSVAAQLITNPKLLFLDEPTSGLDSAASLQVISFIKAIAKAHNLIVIASIHQPSTSTFAMFDKLLLLSRGAVAYSGPTSEIQSYFAACGAPIPLYMNPAEFIIDLVNTDFSHDRDEVDKHLSRVHWSWRQSQLALALVTELAEEVDSHPIDMSETDMEQVGATAGRMSVLLALIHRSLIKSYRDVIAYGIRVAMYMGLAIMMGTVWLRLSPTQGNIQSFINAIFFGGAFMSFMAVAYIPAFLEDRALYVKERANGLYGPTSFLLSNFITGVPYLFLISILFSIVAYWLANFRPAGDAFFTWVMWLFLDLIAAESLVVLISSLVPNFVVALAGTAFANGLWMCTGGFLVPPQTLNPFWRYVFHYIDYQAYVFQGMMVNEFGSRNYSCDVTPGSGPGECSCLYPSDMARECLIDGKAILENYGYSTGDQGKWVGILLAIIVGYRALGWLVLYLKRT
ncbi:putative ABC transporter [Microdochium trichocladiopsis]|uniref:ABC transporter n=1 Tax=Microdochium trichocladiopsis TaxID=1682393 RepID=A0A9P8Y5R0_9PEZI|nr:putative ABC transporter [Microdochium trichocladiopsis]KAH7032565.1 putative ABC transporter [Microdochium trichocladiopsis]